jgi:two-component system, OmpR family, KDP operon response regulator KdpE
MTGSARILVIDDETPIRRFLRVALKADGHSVVEAAAAKAGIDAAALENPAAVILDLG